MKLFFKPAYRRVLLGFGLGLLLFVLGSALLLYGWPPQPAKGRPVLPAKIGEPVLLQTVNHALPTSFAEAAAANEDTVAWLTIDGTSICGPVLQGKNNAVYLRRDVFGAFSNEGSYFADSECSFTPGAHSKNLIVYGHAWQELPSKHFGQLFRFLEEDFAKEYGGITLELGEELRRYEVVSAGIAQVASESLCIKADPTPVEFKEICQLAALRGLLPGRSFECEDDLLTLSTCTADTNTRLLLVARLTEITEKTEDKTQ